jgi:propanol-preferring alcohol dehydrogenase
VLCAGVTVYKGIKETEARPGEWLVVSGIGGLGHMAVQYAKAMGLHVAAVDVAADKLELAKDLGAELTINAAEKDPVKVVQKAFGGAHGVLVTAVNRPAFDQAIGMLRKRGTASLVGLPPGTFELPIFDMVLSRKTIRGSIVGTRNDLSEALQFAADGQVHARFSTDKLENINEIFGRMLAGNIEGRVVLEV